MPATAPLAFATVAGVLPGKPRPYILGITPTSISNHLVLRHPEPEITIADNQSLQSIHVLKGAHTGPVTAVICETGSIWSSAMDATVVRWDERSRRAATTIKAFIWKPLPVTALAVAGDDNLVIGGTELISSEAHILFWDMRNPNEPAYKHSSTHSDDITHLSLLPPTATFASSSAKPLPHRLLLSASTDGCIVLSDLRETDEEEAVQTEQNWNQSVADAGCYMHKGKLRVWARSDMDSIATWGVGTGEDDGGELEFNDLVGTNSDQLKGRSFETPQLGPKTVHPAMEERAYPPRLTSEYLIDVCPSLGTSKTGAPMVGVGDNEGNIIIEHSGKETYTPSGFLVSGPSDRGHKDVVRCMYHAVRDEALYTGSEDGVLAGWNLASMPRLVTGDPEVDDDGGDGREDLDSDNSEDEESEIETEESDRSDSDGGMDLDDEEEPRHGPVYGGGQRVDDAGHKRKR